MAVIRRINKKQNLIDIPAFITEEGIDTKYFQIFGLPEEIPTGKSSFIVGGSPFLKSEVKLKLEILDSRGEVVYTEPVFGYRDGVNRRVSIEVYDASQAGEAVITLLGEIDPNKSDVFIPPEWRGVYNVKYTRRVSINPTLLNVQPIRFHKQPLVYINPLTNAYKEYIQQPEETRILTAALTTDVNVGTSGQTTDPVTQEQSYPEEEQSNKAFDFMSLYNSTAFKQSSFSNFRMPFKFQLFSPASGDSNLIVSSGSLDDGMIGQTVIINDPQVDTNSPNIPTTYTVPSQYSSSIIDITNDTTLNLAKAFYVTGDDGSTKYPVNLSSDQSFSCSFSPVPTEQDSVINYFDLADISLSKLRTFSGDIKYVRVYSISQGSQTEQQFDLLGEFPLESQELLFDYDNIKSGRTGFFVNQTKIDNYWNAFGGTKATTATGSYGLAQTGSFIRYAMDISGSNANLNQEIMAQTSHSFSLSKSVPYELSFKAYGSRTPKTLSSGDKEGKARIDFFISGSNFNPNHNLGGTYGKKILSIDFDNSDKFPELVNLQSYDWNKTYLSGMFIPVASGVGKLQVRVSSGRWHIADVSLRPAADTNFSPEVARIFAEMPTSRNRPDTVKFLLEFVNNDGVKADSVVLSPSVVFPGANFAIQGDNNVLSGSMFISNAIGEGIEMAGLSSAFLRTIGWEGFNSASNAGKGGFILYSGSVLPDSPDNYKGAGLEIHDGNSGSAERFFQFRTDDGNGNAIFKVKTDDYLFGISGSGGVESYISGADGKLEISSSNFSISNTGDVNMAGNVTATTGKIGDWTISSGDIVGANITMDADSSRIYKTDSNGELDGYYMDFTPGSNYYVRFGTDFAVSSSGTLIASGAKIEGILTASEGFIANWTIAPNTINKLTDGTYTGMSAVGDARFFAGAANLNAGTGSAVFNVKDDGQVSGSDVLFTGGRIAGYTISGNTLSASNFVLDASGKSITLGDTATDDVFIVDADTGIQLGHNTFSSAPFSVTKAGVLKAESGTIAGWEILDTQIRTVPNAGVGGQYTDGETGLVIRSSGGIETSDFATGLKGWRISSLGNGSAEFENMRIRGTLRTTVFEKESVNVVGGQLMVANSTTLEPLKDVSGSIVAGAASMSAADVTMSVANVSGFASGEIIKAKKVDDTGFIVEYMMVTGSQSYTHPSSSYSASVAASDMGAVDPDGLAGELYIGRGYGTSNVISSSIGTVASTLATTGTYGTEANVSISIGSNSVTTQSILKMDEERFKVTSASSGIGTTGNNQTIRVLRDYNSTDPAEHTTGTAIYSVDPDAEFLFGLVSSAQAYNAGQVVVSTGKFDASKDLSSGYILMNANPTDISTPYMDIVERTGSGVYDLQLRARLGDLSGLSSGYLYGNEEPGFGLYTDNGFFRGTIQATTGSIHGILHVATSQGGIESGDKISIGRNVSGTNDGIYINAHNYWYTTGAWKVGGSSNYLSLDSAAGGNIAIRSSDLIIDTSTFDISTDNGGVIQLGPAGSTPTLTSGTGIFLSGSGEFRMGDSDGNIRFQDDSFYLTGADVNINVNQLNISASKFTLSSPQASMSLGDSQEILLHATGGSNNVPVFKLDGGEISASNFFVSTGGNLTASNASFDGVISSSEANIGGWTVDSGAVYKGVTRLSSSAEPGLYIEDSFGSPMVLIAEKTMFEIGSDPDEVYNESFEQDPNSQFSSAGRHVGNTESPIMSHVPSWSFSSSGPISHSITKRGGTGFEGFDAAVLGNYTFDVIHPGQFAPFANASQSFENASASYLSGNSYELTQIVSASEAPGNVWKGGNVVSFAGVAKMSHSLGGAGIDRGFQKQKYKVEYWSGTEWITFIPKSQSRAMRSDGFAHYNIGARYNSVAGGGELPANSDKLRITLSGSINPDVSYTKTQYVYEGAVLDPMASLPTNSDEVSQVIILNTEESAKYPYTEIAFDNFRLRQSQPRVELSPDGFLLYSSDSSYIKMTPEGIDFRGGQGFSQTSTMMAGESLSDNVDVYGSLAAPAVQAYEADPSDVSTTGFQGNVGEYAMGNHRHALSFSTINSLMNGQTISNGTWQGNTVAVGYGGTGATSLNNLITLGDHTTGNFMTNVSAGTGIDVTHTPAEGSTATVAVDVSDFMSNGSNNYVVTATGADAMNAESNLTFDGSTLAVTGTITSTGTATFANLSGSNIYGSGLYISSSAATNVIQVGADGSGGIQKWEWHRDGTRRWLIYNDGRTDQSQPQDSMVFKHGLVTDGDDHINFHMEQDDQNVYFHGNVLPSSDAGGDLGSSTKEWNNLYVDGTANIDSLVADTADINGGTIDGATIATSDITVGSGKTLNVSAGTLTLAANQISGDKVEGGTIAATTITALTTAGITATANIDIGSYDLTAATITADGLTSGRVVFAGTGGVLSDSSAMTFGSSTLTVTKIGAYEQAGSVDFSDEAMTNVNIDSGDIASGVTINKSPVVNFNSGDVQGTVTLSALATGTGALTIQATSVEGSMLNTNVISGQTNMTGDVADADELMISDDGTLKRIDFSVFRDAVYNDVSGDATVADGGALTIAATSVEGSMLNDNIISGQGALGSATVAQADLLLIDDGPGTIKSVTFSNFEDSIFNNISGDIAIAAGGAATIQANSVALGVDTTNDYVASLVAGTGIDLSNNSGETATPTVAVDVSDFMSNGANNYVVTATGADAMNAEANLTFDGSTLTLGDTGTFGTSTFVSALVGGDGFRIDDGGSNGTTMEIDNIVVRNTLRTHIFQKDVVKATNGYLYVSDSCVISAIPSSTTVKMRDDKSAIFSSFPVTMWCKEADSTDGTITSVIFSINSLAATGGSGDEQYHTYNVTYSAGAYTDLQIGMTAVRTSGGNVLIDASSANSPFVDVIDSGTVKARLGNLAGISDADLGGTLTGHGIYTSNVYLKGNIAVKSDNALSLANSTIMIGNITGTANSALKLTNTGTTSTSGLFGYNSAGSEVIRLRLDGNHQLAGWDIVPGKLQYDNAAGSIAMDASNQNISVHTGSINTSKPKIVLGNLPTTGAARYGLAVFSGTDNADINTDSTYSVLITRDKARLAGWDMSPGKLESGTVAVIDGNEGKIALGTGATTYTGGAGGITNPTPTANLFFVSASTNPIFFVGANFSYVNDTLKAAGWTVDTNSITTTGVGLHSTNYSEGAELLLGHQTAYASAGIGLKGDGSGKLAFGNIVWDTSGNITYGSVSSENIHITSGGDMLFRNATTTIAEMDGTTWTIGGPTGTTADALVITSNAVTIYGNDANTGVFITDDNIEIKSDADADKITIDNNGMSVTAASQVRANFGTTVTLGYTSDAYMTLASDALKMYDEAGTQQVELNTGTLTLGGADGDTSDTVVIDGSSVTIYGNDSSTGVFITDNQIEIKSDADADKITIDNSGMSVTADSQVRANFGTTVTLGYTSDAYMTLASDAMKMYDEAGTQQVELNTGTLTLGGADGDTSDTVVIDGSSVTIYGNDSSTGVFITDDNIAIKADADADKITLDNNGMTVTAASADVASFGATTTIGVTGTTGAYTEIISGELKIKNNTSTFLKANSGGLGISGSLSATTGDIGGLIIATGSVKTVDPTGDEDYLEIDNAANSITLYKGGDQKAQLRTKIDSYALSTNTFNDSISQLKIDDGFIQANRDITYDNSSCCFVRGTKINTENGLRNIEDLKIGDLVWAYDFDNNKLKLVPILTQTNPMRSRLVEITFTDKTKLTCTYDHPFYSDSKGWISFDPEETKLKYGNEVPELLECNQIEVNDEILDGFNGDGTIINIIPLEHGSTETFIFQTEFRNFFAEGKLSHNKTGCQFGGAQAVGGSGDVFATITGDMTFSGDEIGVVPAAQGNPDTHIAAGVAGISDGTQVGTMTHAGIYGYATGTDSGWANKRYLSGYFRGAPVAIDNCIFIGGDDAAAEAYQFLGLSDTTLKGAINICARTGTDGTMNRHRPTGVGDGGIVWGGDTTLYRSSAHNLETQDNFTVQLDLDVTGDLDVDGTSNLDVVDIDGAVDMGSTLTFSGNSIGSSPTPPLDFGTFYDNSGNPSISHIKLYSTHYGFGISGNTLNYISAMSHSFLDSGDLANPVASFVNGYAHFDGHIETGNGYDLIVNYNGSKSNRTYLDWQGLQLGNNGVNYIVAGNTSTGGYLQFHTNNSTDMLGFSGAPGGYKALVLKNNYLGAVFNEDAADYDFRVESEGNSTMFGIDASINQVYIGQNESTGNGRSFQVKHAGDGDYVARIWNDANISTCYGIILQAGDDTNDCGAILKFNDGNGGNMGIISFAGGTVSYGTFTGHHDAYVLDQDSHTGDILQTASGSAEGAIYPIGTIVSLVSSSLEVNPYGEFKSQPINYVVSSSAHQDKRAFGIYHGSYNWGDGSEDDVHKDLVYRHLISGLGDGVVLVNDQGGDIEIGDYICTASGSGGYGCKQSDDILHNYTVAKINEDVVWSAVSGSTKLVACTYHCS